jgi:hypothetical protein
MLTSGGLLFGACNGGTPQISDTVVTPSNIALSEFESSIQFSIRTNVLHMGDDIDSVTATVQGQDIVYDLVQSGDVVGGESWALTTTLTLWSGISEGTYYIDVTAISSDGETVTLAKAATVTVTS